MCFLGLWPKLISRKIWVAEKYWNFHIVYIFPIRLARSVLIWRIFFESFQDFISNSDFLSLQKEIKKKVKTPDTTLVKIHLTFFLKSLTCFFTPTFISLIFTVLPTLGIILPKHSVLTILREIIFWSLKNGHFDFNT